MLFIMVLFHLSAYKDFKHFWLYGIEHEYRSCFMDIPSYGRFVSLMPRLFMPLCLLLHSLRGEQTGIYFIDSTKLSVCHKARSSRNRVFAGMARRGKTSIDWFYGFKLHLVINDKGEIMAVRITPGNTDDRTPVQSMVKKLQGKLFGDRGYISKELFQKLWKNSIQLITGIRKNMKNHLMPILDKIYLKKRSIIETIFDKFKSQMGLEHSRHRSPTNAFVHVISCLVAYSMGKNKPKINAAYP